MFVSSYLEMHTVLAGWALYDIIFDVLFATGVIYLPFLAMIIRIISNEVDEDQTTTRKEVKNLLIVVWGLFVFIFVLIPFYPVQPDQVFFQPSVSFDDLNPTPVSAAEDATTYSDFFQSQTARAPLIWIFIQNVNAGLAHVVRQSLPKEPDLAELKNKLQYTAVQDPSTRAEYRKFSARCFLPASDKFRNWGSEGNLTPQIEASIARWGQEDLNWPGSRVFQETPGLYAQCPSFSPDADNICGANLFARQPVEGLGDNPICGDWWNVLKNRLLQEDTANLTRWQNVQNFFGGLSDEEVEDLRLKNMMRNIYVSDISSTDEYTDRNWIDKVVGVGQDLLTIPTIASDVVAGDTETRIYRKMMPMVVALLMMFITAFLPILMTLSLYSPSAIFTMIVMFFGIQFLGTIFAISSWTETVLIRSIMDGVPVGSYLFNPIDVTQNRLLLSRAADYATFAAMILWFSLLSMVVQGVSALGRGVTAGAGGVGSLSARAGAGAQRNATALANRVSGNK